MEYIGFIASFTMGIVLGLMGGGGSILTVPILVYLFALSPMIATGYSLFVVGTTALIGSLMYIRKGGVDFQAGLVFSVPSVIGVNISRGIIIPQIPTHVARLGTFLVTKEILIMVVFAMLMVAASYSMIKKKNDRKPLNADRITRMSLIGLLGLAVGVIAGFVGAGGGFLIIPALVFVTGLSMRVAVGTSLMIIAFQSLFGFAGDIIRGLSINWLVLGTITTFAIAGITLGSSMAHKIKEHKLKTAFGWFVLAMGTTILFQQLFQLSS